MTKFNWELYAWVARGSQRKKIMQLMTQPKMPTELQKEAKLALSDVSRVLISFVDKGLAECLTPKHKIGRVYQLTASGEAIRKQLI